MSFAIVLFADGKSRMFNTNCRNFCLLKSLRHQCNEVCQKDDQIDLADENGECKLLSRSLEGYACDTIAPRERLVLLRVEEACQDDNLANPFKLVPLLNNLQDNKDFMSLLNPTAVEKTQKGAGTAKLSSSRITTTRRASNVLGFMSFTSIAATNRVPSAHGNRVTPQSTLATIPSNTSSPRSSARLNRQAEKQTPKD